MKVHSFTYLHMSFQLGYMYDTKKFYQMNTLVHVIIAINPDN